MVVLSIDRYYAILNPFRVRIENKVVIKRIIFIWLISFLISILHLHNFQINDFKTFKQCLPNKNISLFEYHTVFLVFSQYCIPFFIISFTYARIGIHIYFDDSPLSITKNQELNKKKVL